MTTDFRVTGQHVLVALIVFFLIILSVNVVFIKYAVRTFPGEKEEKSYLQGMNYNDRLAAREQQASLAWTAMIRDAILTNGRLDLRVAIIGRDGDPISGLQITGVLSRPTHAAHDRSFDFLETGDGEYTASSQALTGVWDLEAKAVDPKGHRFEFTNRLVLE